jgi:hypothetical protein
MHRTCPAAVASTSSAAQPCVGVIESEEVSVLKES